MIYQYVTTAAYAGLAGLIAAALAVAFGAAGGEVRPCAGTVLDPVPWVDTRPVTGPNGRPCWEEYRD